MAQIGRQAAQGLAYAHASGIVHRDIKPSNLLLDHAGVVWIADFGLAKGDDEGLTQTGDILGTLRYMAPERFRGEGDARADIYALGLTLYELLTLRPAFDSSDRLEADRADQERGAAAAPIHRCPDPAGPGDDRPQGDREGPRERGTSRPRRWPRTSGGSSPTSRSGPARSAPAERYWRWARRNPAIAVLGGVLTALLVAVAVGSMVAASYFRSLAGSRRRRSARCHDRARQGSAKREGRTLGRYRSNIAAASGALQLQNSGAARIALEDAPKEHRNWEWQYLHSQLDGASLVLPVPGGKIRSLVLSPSGRQIAVCCFDHNEVYLYDVATGRLEAVLRGHSAPATSVAYRPDGKQVATGGNDQTIRLWDPATGEQTALLKAEVAPPNLDREPLVAYNADGSRIASAGFKVGREHSTSRDRRGVGTSRLWDATTGKEIAVLAKWQEGTRPVAFSPDGKRVAVGSGEYVHLCDAVTGRRLAVLGPHPKAVDATGLQSGWQADCVFAGP